MWAVTHGLIRRVIYDILSSKVDWSLSIFRQIWSIESGLGRIWPSRMMCFGKNFFRDWHRCFYVFEQDDSRTIQLTCCTWVVQCFSHQNNDRKALGSILTSISCVLTEPYYCPQCVAGMLIWSLEECLHGVSDPNYGTEDVKKLHFRQHFRRVLVVCDPNFEI
jgi:hypothetical protein